MMRPFVVGDMPAMAPQPPAVTFGASAKAAGVAPTLPAAASAVAQAAVQTRLLAPLGDGVRNEK